MNHRDDYVGSLFATDACEEVRSDAYQRLNRGFGANKGASEGAAECVNNAGYNRSITR